MLKKNKEIFLKITSKLIKIWHEIIGYPAPSVNAFSYYAVKGQGATSSYFKLKVTVTENSTYFFFIKKYGGESSNGSIFWRTQAVKDYSTRKGLAKHLNSNDGFYVNSPYFLLPDDNFLVEPYVEGINLGPYFFKTLKFHFVTQKSFHSLDQIIPKIGYGLAELQAIPVDYFSNIMKPISHGDVYNSYLANIDCYYSYLKKRGFSSRLLETVRDKMAKHLKRYFNSTPEFCFQHNDFILQNFTLDDHGRLHLFDFPNATIGFHYADVAHFVSSLEDLTYPITVSKKRVSRLIQKFMESMVDKNDFEYQTFLAFKLYYQFYSTTILLSSLDKSGLKLKQLLLCESPEKRFVKNVKLILEQLS